MFIELHCGTLLNIDQIQLIAEVQVYDKDDKPYRITLNDNTYDISKEEYERLKNIVKPYKIVD